MFPTTYSDDCFVNTKTPNYVDQWVCFNNRLYVQRVFNAAFNSIPPGIY